MLLQYFVQNEFFNSRDTETQPAQPAFSDKKDNFSLKGPVTFKSEYQAIQHTHLEDGCHSAAALTAIQNNFKAPHNVAAATTTKTMQTSVVREEDKVTDKKSDSKANKAPGIASNISGSNVMQITKCPHVNRKHYAKNMCSSCYRKFGRNQNAWACAHTDKLLYSMGMCQTCYLADYHKKRTKIKKEKEAEEARQRLLKGKRVIINEEDNEFEPHEHDITNREVIFSSCHSISSESIRKINQDIKKETIEAIDGISE